ncbi:glycosyl bnr repeat-containing protein [Leptolyngbya sp. Heron Island J]|uniref:WD40/YVTN/BNR-like repeat-containing protein n=1 Tax=Leptolyngbya sp. Heron Island J TaxID=1385935 RepID=UPI0003B93F54|nr:YCF48-related protein [Leptolyngbya sp. Heron Island J]ESA38637.1 glycosyl bnr repeat-containing protein [Leptolyngbya sp. Heron Island J]
MDIATRFLVAYLLVFIGSMQAAFAHTPHDDIHDVEISPNYSQDQTLFIITRGVLLKSQDSGQQWHKIVNGLNNKHSLTSVDISGEDANILYVSSRGDGVYKSEDGGTAWSKVNKGLKTLEIDFVEISDNAPNVIFAAGIEGGLYKTENGGETWRQVLAAPDAKITAISSLPENSNHLMAGDQMGRVFISNNDGEDWEQRLDIPNAGGITAIEFSPYFESDNTVFLGTEKLGIFKGEFQKGPKKIDPLVGISDGLPEQAIQSLMLHPEDDGGYMIFSSTSNSGVFISEDLGGNWENYSQGLSKDDQATKFNRPQFSNLEMANSLDTERKIYLAGYDGLFRTELPEQKWRQLDTLSSNIITGIALSPNYENDSTIAVATYVSGVYISHDAGTTWKNVSNGLEDLHKYIAPGNSIARMFNIGFSPDYVNDRHLFTVTRHGFWHSNNDAEKWRKSSLDLENLDPLHMVISPSYGSDGVLFAGNYKTGEIFKSSNMGVSFQPIGSINSGIKSFQISPNFSSDKTLYAGGGQTVFKSIDEGRSWVSVGDFEGNITSLAISTTDKMLIAGTTSGAFIWKDQGNSWLELNIDGVDAHAQISAVSISPSDGENQLIILSIHGKGLYKSEDRGDSFFPIADELIDANYQLSDFSPNFFNTGQPIVFSPAFTQDKKIYGYAGENVLKSQDGGNTWEVISLPEDSKKSNFKRFRFRLRFLSAFLQAQLDKIF